MGSPETVEPYVEPALEALPPLPRRRRSAAQAQASASRRRLRRLYFSVAALWGFLAGTSAVLILLRASDHPARLGAAGMAALLVAAVVALGGALVAAAAYRAASRRLR